MESGESGNFVQLLQVPTTCQKIQVRPFKLLKKSILPSGQTNISYPLMLE